MSTAGKIWLAQIQPTKVPLPTGYPGPTECMVPSACPSLRPQSLAQQWGGQVRKVLRAPSSSQKIKKFYPKFFADIVLSPAQNLQIITIIHNYLCCMGFLCTWMKLLTDLRLWIAQKCLAAGGAIVWEGGERVGEMGGSARLAYLSRGPPSS